MHDTPRRVTLKSAREAFERREHFDCNATLWGIRNPVDRRLGRLAEVNPALAREYGQALHDRQVAYVVLSYWTPIFWELKDGTQVNPGIFYTHTTRRHQEALGLIEEAA